MKKREFNKALNTISTGRGKKKRIDVSKIQLLDDETRKKWWRSSSAIVSRFCLN